jgi:hypothetical protein
VIVRAGEDALTQAILALAAQYGRYGNAESPSWSTTLAKEESHWEWNTVQLASPDLNYR